MVIPRNINNRIRATRVPASSPVADHDHDDDTDMTLTGTETETESETDSGETETDEDADALDTILADINDAVDRVQENTLQMCADTIQSRDVQMYLRQVPSLDPTITDLIQNPHVKDKDKIKVCELYAIMSTSDPVSWEWIEARAALKERMSKALETARMMEGVDQKLLRDNLRKLKLNTVRPMKERIALLDADDKTKSVIYNKYKEMETYTPHDSEYAKIGAWIHFALNVPYNETRVLASKNSAFLKSVHARLNDELYGLKKVKEQILLFLNTRLMNPTMKGCTLALVGDRGVGKTHIARSLAAILDVPFEQISCGGINQPEVLTGHQFTYIGAKEGLILSALVKMKCKNGILFFDEFDKITNSDINNAMLHVTDFKQNMDFVDQFLGPDIPVDLSCLWFVFAMNKLPESEPLTDRLFVIHIDGYTQHDKTQILQHYLLKRVCANAGLNPGDIVLSDHLARTIVNRVCSSDVKGVRLLENAVVDMVNKIAFLVNTSVFEHCEFEHTMSFKRHGITAYPVVVTQDMVNNLVAVDTSSTSTWNMLYS